VYKKRSDIQEGWNNAVIEICEKQGEILEELGISVLDEGVFVK